MMASRPIKSVARLLLVVTLGAATLLLGGAAAADTTIIDLGNLGANYAGANDINDRGQIVGLSATPEWSAHAFLWQDGTMTDLALSEEWDPLDYDRIATDINNRGQIVGFVTLMDGLHAWIWQDGVMSELRPFPGGSSCYPSAIDEAGAVVGHCWTGVGETHAFIWRAGTMTDLWTLGCLLNDATGINNRGDILGGTSTGPALCTRNGLQPLCFLESDCGLASAINDRGQIAGTAGEHAVLWSQGIVTDLGTLGGPTSNALDINNKGQIVGYSQTGTLDNPGSPHAFLWDGVMHDLGGIGEGSFLDSSAVAINQSGDIVGYSVSDDETGQHALLWPASGR